MNIFKFGPRRLKRFVVLVLAFWVVPLLSFIPFAPIKMWLFLPLLFWIKNIVGIPLAIIGISYFEIHEFGAVPEGTIGYGIIVFVYIMAAFFLSLIGKQDDS
jgi:hypothetical protein